MKNHDLTFGAGKRVCMGRSVSILETYKVMTTLFLTYEVSCGSLEYSGSRDWTDVYQMSLVDPSQEWHILYSWFTRQTGIDVKLQRRNRMGA